MGVTAGAIISGALSGAAAGSAAGLGTAGIIATAAIGAGLSYYRVESAELDRGDFQSSFEQQSSNLTKQIKQPVTSRRVVYGKTRLSGAITMMETQNNNMDLHYFLTICEGPIEGFQKFFVFDEQVKLNSEGWVKSGKYKDLIRIRVHNGERNQRADALAVQETDTVDRGFRGRGVAYMYIKAKFDRKVFDEFPDISTVVKGRNDIWDPRDGNEKYTDNSALCTADYLLDDKVGLQADRDEIDQSRLKTAANVCNENVQLDGGDTHDRYETNGVLNTSNKVRKNISNLLSSMAGRMTWANGQWKIFAGTYNTPDVSLDESDRAGDIEVQGQVPADQRFNGVRGVYRAEKKSYQPTDFPAVSKDVYLENDGNIRRWKDIDLPFTANSARAQRIAQIHLERARQQISTTWSLKLQALDTLSGETIELSDDHLGWNNKTFRVESVQVEQGGGSGEGEDVPALTLQSHFRETDTSVYDWSSEDEQPESISSPSSSGDISNVSEPTNVTLDSGADELLRQADGELISRIRITWDDPRTRILGGSVQAQSAFANGSMSTGLGTSNITGTAQAQDSKVFGITGDRRIIGTVQAQSATTSGSISRVLSTRSISGSVQAVDARVQGIEERSLAKEDGGYTIQWRRKDAFENTSVWPNQKQVEASKREAFTTSLSAGKTYQVRIRKFLNLGFVSDWVQKEVTSVDQPPAAKTAGKTDDIIVAGDKDTDKTKSQAEEVASTAGLAPLDKRDFTSTKTTVDFTDAFDTTHNFYKLHIGNLYLTDAADFGLRFSNDNGSSWISDTAYDTQWTRPHDDENTQRTDTTTSDLLYLHAFGVLVRDKAASSRPYSAEVTFVDPLNSNEEATVYWQAYYEHDSGTSTKISPLWGVQGWGVLQQSKSFDAFQLLVDPDDSEDIDQATMELYGYL